MRRQGAGRLRIVVVATVAVLASTVAVDGVGTRRPALAAAHVAGWPAGRPAPYTLRYNDPDVSTAEAPRRRMVVLNAWEWSAIAKIKSANPNVLVLVYKDLSSARTGFRCGASQDDIPTGVDYCDADANHPEWFLTDSAGKRLPYDGYPDSWQMDVGNPAYQQAWLDNVRAGLAARGWDGVFLDNALTRADDYHPGVVSPRYPTNESIQEAYKTFLRKVGDGLTQFTMANAGARLFPGLWKSYIAPLDGGYEEFFVDWSAEPNGSYAWDSGPNGWMAQIEQITDAEAMGKVAVVRSGSMEPTVDTEGFKYSLGSYLLANGGHSMFSFGYQSSRHPTLDWDLGVARGNYYSIGKSVFRRDFSAGVVVVNASEATTVTIPLQGEYLDENAHVITSVTLAPQRAAILRAVSPPSPPRSPTPPPRSPTPPSPITPQQTGRPPAPATGRIPSTATPAPGPAPVPAPTTARAAEPGVASGIPPDAERQMPGGGGRDLARDGDRSEFSERWSTARVGRAGDSLAKRGLLGVVAVGLFVGVVALALRLRRTARSRA